MTAARRRAKAGFTAALLILMLNLTLSGAAADEPLVINPDTGLAISGFDPVAYFVDGKAEVGRPELELSRDGAIWRFVNAGNRAAFAAHPDVYRPRFGGYDPVAVALERSVAGHPMFWSVLKERLYLFYSAANREAFLADPGRVIQTAERRWPAVERTIAR